MSTDTPTTSILSGYLSRAALAKQINRSVRTLERWEALREGPPVTHMGRDPFYRIDAVKEWLKSCERPMPRAGRKAA
jgi:hypothetical protein